MPVALLSDIMIISIIVIITLMIYRDMKFLLSPIPTIVPEKIYREHLSHLPVRQARDLRSYSGDKLNLLGEVMVRVAYKGQECKLPLVIIKGEKPALFERNWLEKIKLHWGRFFQLTSPIQ